MIEVSSEDFQLYGGDLIELDPNELETIFTDQNFLNFGNLENSGDGYQEEVQEQIIPQTCPQVELKLNDERTDRAELASEVLQPFEQKLMLLAIPSSMQSAAVFNSLPNVQLQPNDINKIAAASTGHDGVFLPKTQKASRAPLIIRRPPLQIIQQLNLNLPIEQKPIDFEAAPAQCKRKQHFNLTREDGIAFYDELPDSHETVKSPSEVCDFTNDDDFKWASSDDEVLVVHKPAVDESTRCPTCHRVFKKLSNHKCKNEDQSKLKTAAKSFSCGKCNRIFHQAAAFKKHTSSCNGICRFLICAGCDKSFKSKIGLTKHLSQCNRSKAVNKDLKTEFDQRFEPMESDELTEDSFTNDHSSTFKEDETVDQHDQPYLEDIEEMGLKFDPSVSKENVEEFDEILKETVKDSDEILTETVKAAPHAELPVEIQLIPEVVKLEQVVVKKQRSAKKRSSVVIEKPSKAKKIKKDASKVSAGNKVGVKTRSSHQRASSSKQVKVFPS